MSPGAADALAIWLPLILAALLGPLGVAVLHRAHRLRGAAMVRPAPGRETRLLAAYRRLVGRSPAGRWLRRHLERGGLAWHPGDVLLGALAGWGVCGVLAHNLLALKPAGAALAAAVMVATTGKVWLDARRDWQQRRFAQQLPEVTWLLGSALKAGLSLPQALALVPREADNPARRILQRVVDEVALGRPLDEVLLESAQQAGNPDYSLMVTIALIQHRAGGDLAGAMADLSQTLTERQSVQEEVQAATAGARFTATLLPLMPLFCAVLLNVAIPGALNVLFTLWGALLVTGFLVFQWLAYVAIRKLSEIRV